MVPEKAAPGGATGEAMRALFRLRVALRGEDLAAISALEALRDELGAADLAALSRESVWEIEVPGGLDDIAQARERLETAARESLLFANPVKERWTLEEGPLRLGRAGAGRCLVGLLVTDRPDRAGPACTRALATDWGIAGAAVRRDTLWILDLPDTGRDAAAARARVLGVTTARRSGLLVNPHYQDWTLVFEDEVLVDDARAV
jgi:hypothetical protein